MGKRPWQWTLPFPKQKGHSIEAWAGPLLPTCVVSQSHSCPGIAGTHRHQPRTPSEHLITKHRALLKAARLQKENHQPNVFVRLAASCCASMLWERFAELVIRVTAPPIASPKGERTADCVLSTFELTDSGASDAVRCKGCV